MGYLCLLDDCDTCSFFPSFPCSHPLFLLNHAIPSSLAHLEITSSLFLWWEHNPSFYFGDKESSVNIPSSFLLFPPSCEIAVVSYGFLFLRDGRWVHVGVKATKHAVSAQRAGQHTVSFLWIWQLPCPHQCPAHYQECARSKNSHCTEWLIF